MIPLSRQERAHEPEGAHSSGLLEVGTTVRVIRDPYFGRIGSVAALPAQPRVLDSESKARILTVEFEAGEAVVVPRANVELIEE